MPRISRLAQVFSEMTAVATSADARFLEVKGRKNRWSYRSKDMLILLAPLGNDAEEPYAFRLCRRQVE